MVHFEKIAAGLLDVREGLLESADDITLEMRVMLDEPSLDFSRPQSIRYLDMDRLRDSLQRAAAELAHAAEIAKQLNI